MPTPYIGQIDVFAFGIVPKGYAPCNGQLLPINQYSALFSVLGTMYGGNGVSTFALLNLQSCVAVGSDSQVLGVTGGSEEVTLTPQQIPAHNHVLQASTAVSDSNFPADTKVLGQSTGTMNGGGAVTINLYGPQPANTTLSPAAIAQTGGSQGHSNLMPYLAVNYCIALNGLFPSRN
jgi:microcystin-dependent protein